MAAPKFQFKLLRPDARLPTRNRETDACYDLYSPDSIWIAPGKVKLIHTGLALAAPPGWYYTLEGRSSLFLRGIFPMRGIIDSCYTGEVVVGLFNSSDEWFRIEPGDRIAHLAIHQAHFMETEEVEEFAPEYSVRGTAGWGSSGK